MQNGIYHVTFSSSLGSGGEGLIVVSEQAINGGDAGYVYQGRLTTDGEAVSGSLNIKRFKPGHVSVFGQADQFVLDLAGTFNASTSTFQVTGNVHGMPQMKISISGNKVSILA